ncbi:bifunctional aspartate transaminase/aspartate 4-decarboxylase [Actinomadura hibisca]|uniref:bifunctional aspartate transaminase/aspartate 4-decarboxylase n=1 Tax=Actinomadura hibisca TaxID=68565 RepID=UPI000833DE9A|nr:bifunctional aspartate transaminase/aspartate 4-decarboxylase [Actinomadura hibisca]
MTTRDEERRWEALSPFELKDELITLADDNTRLAAVTMLNAGRGNPNWTATVPRDAFWLLGRFATGETRRDWDEWEGLGGMPQSEGIAGRLTAFLAEHRGESGADLLSASVEYGVSRLGFDADSWVGELADAIIGDHYPMPPRSLAHVERVVARYLVQEMHADREPDAPFDLFPTEGGTAAMCYLFDSLQVNGLLGKGDTIAIMTPVFTPYLEIPKLERYAFDVLELKADCTDQQGVHTWQYADDEIDKLRDPKVKALFLVNPSNPPSVMLAPGTLDRIAEIVGRDNPDLAIITDDVYGTFVSGFRSLMAAAPRNTLGVYSFSKYFGCTGWRLGVISLSQDNVFDERIARLPDADKQRLRERYGSITLEPDKLRFIDRLVADSRDVALNHTAGLSTPQQAQMALFALFALLDEEGEYKRICQSVIARRLHSLVKGMGVPVPHDEHAAHYYVELDILSYVERTFDKGFADWLQANFEPADPVFRLAEKGSVVLLNGGGFDGPGWSVRVSLANLPSDAYEKIGTWLRQVVEEYKTEYDASQAG